MSSKDPSVVDTGQISYDGSRVTTVVSFSSGQNGESVTLSQSHVKELEITTELGKLYSQGFVVYEDPVGDVPRIMSMFDVVCTVVIKPDTQSLKGNGQIDSQVPVTEQVFVHRFQVDNVEIIGNDNQYVRYCIYLTGVEHTNLENNVEYSDWDKGENERNDIVKTVREMLVAYGKLKVDKTFDSVSSGVKINYASSGNDTVQSAVDYLMQKQFFYPDMSDGSIKMLVYDIHSDTYGIFQLGQSKPTGSSGVLYVSMNNSVLDQMIAQDKVRLATDSTCRKSDMYRPMSDMIVRSYDLESGKFGSKTYPSSSFVGFLGGNNRQNRLVPVANGTKINMFREYSEWNNDSNAYRDFLDIFTRWDSVIVNAPAEVGRKLMSVMAVGFDDETGFSGSETTNQAKEQSSRYSQLKGLWYVTKIRYILKGNGEFRQNLRLSRTIYMK